MDDSLCQPKILKQNGLTILNVDLKILFNFSKTSLKPSFIKIRQLVEIF